MGSMDRLYEVHGLHDGQALWSLCISSGDDGNAVVAAANCRKVSSITKIMINKNNLNFEVMIRTQMMAR